MRFFLSFFTTKAGHFANMQQQFLDAIATNDYEYYNSAVYRGYPRVFQELDQSDIFVAFVDAGWTSSTWKAIELYYASGLSPENNGAYIQSSLPCYLYIDDDEQRQKTPVISKILQQNLPHLQLFDGTWEGLFGKLAEGGKNLLA